MSKMKSSFSLEEILRSAMKLTKYKNFVYFFQINKQELLQLGPMELLTIGNHSIYTRQSLLVMDFSLEKNHGSIV